MKFEHLFPGISANETGLEILHSRFEALSKYRLLAQRGELKNSNSLKNYGLISFDDYVETFREQYPTITKKYLFDSGFTKSIRIANKANLIINRYNTMVGSIFEEHEFSIKLIELFKQLTDYTNYDLNLDKPLNPRVLGNNQFGFKDFQIEIIFLVHHDPVDVSRMDINGKTIWTAGYEGVSPFIEFSKNYSDINVKPIFETIASKIKDIEQLVQMCNKSSNNYIIGEIANDFDFVLNCNELEIQLQKQYLLLEHYKDDILKNYHIIMQFIYTYILVNDYPKR